MAIKVGMESDNGGMDDKMVCMAEGKVSGGVSEETDKADKAGKTTMVVGKCGESV